MNEPASTLSLLIVEIIMIIHFVAVEFKLDKIREEIKEVKKLYGNSTIRPHRNEPYRADNKSSLRDETHNQDGKAVH